ncbi:sugar kinase [Cellulomonas fimi]|uniref:Sugar kinase n=2 Tax=Cellulomonas fimi TaxID=1708 RepID=A0A7Y0M0F6_CELFI|nr:sugar kinase [Cellulomonas fimi]
MALVAPTDGERLARTSSVALTYAGAESNVARHLADLGLASCWVSALGDDPLGERIAAGLAAASVDVSWVPRRADAPTGVFFKDPTPGGTRVLYYRHGSAASALSPGDVDGWPLDRTRLVHLTGITPALSESCAAMTDAVLDRCAALGVPVSFDVNHRATLWSTDDAAERLLALARRATIVLVGLDEAERLWSTSTADDVAALIDGPRLVVVKDSDREAVEIDRSAGVPARHAEPARRVHVVEPVGAGDAFAAGFLGAWLRGDPAPERLRLGHSLAAWTMGTVGDHRPGHGPVVRPEGDEEADGR